MVGAGGLECWLVLLLVVLVLVGVAILHVACCGGISEIAVHVAKHLHREVRPFAVGEIATARFPLWIKMQFFSFAVSLVPA